MAGLTTACSDDDTPVIQKPTTFTLNTPALAEQYYDLTPEGSIVLTCSQPDYGYVASTVYSVEISLDKEEVYPITPEEPTNAVITLKDADVAMGMCVLRGIEGEDDWTDAGYQELYVRATAAVNGVEGYEITSDWIKLSHVKGYFAVPVAGYIYLIGTPSEWNMTANENLNANWRLYEQVIGSKVYVGTFDMPAGPMFRFYTELDGNWDTFSYGPANNHGGATEESDGALNVTCEFNAEGVFEDGLISTKDNFDFRTTVTEAQKWTIVVDMNSEKNMKVKFTLGEVAVSSYVYMVGNQSGWAEPKESAADIYEQWRLEDDDNDGIYTGTFAIAEGSLDGGNDLYCRFYRTLSGWGAAQWAGAEAGDTNLTVTSGQAYPTVAGEGCFELKGAGGHTLTVSLDTNNNEITFTLDN